jgi:hypothetical protein
MRMSFCSASPSCQLSQPLLTCKHSCQHSALPVSMLVYDHSMRLYTRASSNRGASASLLPRLSLYTFYLLSLLRLLICHRCICGCCDFYRGICSIAATFTSAFERSCRLLVVLPACHLQLLLLLLYLHVLLQRTAAPIRITY